jgi:ATP-binding cassette subfamily B protein
VLILDEATSSLDLRSETVIEGALDRLLEGRSAILIAHRLTTAQRADRIVVIDKGGIIEMGTPSELLASGGAYARMYDAWLASGGRDVTHTER